MLTDIAQYAKPALSIIDAIWGMEGDGPCSGQPRKIGALIVSDNPFAADIAAVSIIGIQPSDVPMLRRAIQRKLAPAGLNEMECLGEPARKLFYQGL